jgi:hypothetical protein
MAAPLRNLKPTIAPTGRFIRVRQMAGGDPRQTRMVEVQLGCREDRSDFNRNGYCMARRRGSFDQCGRRPARGSIVCGAHGGGHAVRQREGTSLSPQEAGRLSGLARRIKRDGRADFAQFPASLPWLQERADLLRSRPDLLALQEDIVQLTSLRDLVLSGQLDIDAGDLVRMVATLVQVKANALRSKQALEAPGMIHPDKVRAIILQLVQLLQTYVPEERHPQLHRELVTLGASPAIFQSASTTGTSDS